MQRSIGDRKAVSPSVRPSFRPSNAWIATTNETSAHCYIVWKLYAFTFCDIENIGGEHHIIPEILGQTDPLTSETPTSSRYSLVTPRP